MIAISITNCVLPNGLPCTAKYNSSVYRLSNDDNTRNNNVVASFRPEKLELVNVCNITLRFPSGTTFGTSVQVRLDFTDQQFYASHIQYTVRGREREGGETERERETEK
jgi:hypothetical protein